MTARANKNEEDKETKARISKSEVTKAISRPRNTKADLQNLNLRRSRPRKEVDDDDLEPTPLSVSAGPIDRVIELAFNPSRDKIREVTIIDRLQGRLFPILDVMDSLYRNCIEVACYRQSKMEYRKLFKKAMPEPMDVMDELLFRTAQWQKSVAGKNLERATDIALAETETRGPEDEDYNRSSKGFYEE